VRENLTKISAVFPCFFFQCFDHGAALKIEHKMWWWCYLSLSERWGHEETPRRPNSRATP